MKTLHIIKNLNDQKSFAAIHRLARTEDNAVLLMQDAVYENVHLDSVKVYVCHEDQSARKTENGLQQVSYDEIAQLVIEFDRTIVW